MYGTLSGAIEPIAAVLGLFLAFLFQPLMPWALAFAAGCMLYVIAEEMVPAFTTAAPCATSEVSSSLSLVMGYLEVIISG